MTFLNHFACFANALRSLLGDGGAAEVAVGVSVGVELAGASLDGLPSLAGGRGSALVADSGVDTGLKKSERVLDVGALGEASTEESGVDGNQDPGAALEGDGREQEANPEKNLERGHNRHGGIVVLLDESANLVGDRVVRVLGLAARGSTSSGRDGLRRSDGGDHVGARVSCDVEDRVDGVREHGQGVLGGQKPHQGHD